MAATKGFTVSGGAVDRAGYPSGPVALSAAITLASRLVEDGTLYVRHPDGEPYGRVERLGRAVHIYAKGERA
jgi:hypothetical protein